MSVGPRPVSGWRAWVLAIGGMCELGGTVILIKGFRLAGWWAVGIGSSMILFEVAAIVGGIVVETNSRKDSVVN